MVERRDRRGGERALHPRRALRRLPLALLIALGGAGCVEAELLQERDGGRFDAGPRDGGPVDAAGACLSGPVPPTGTSAEGTCTLARPPSRPIGCTDPETGEPPIELALKDPLFGERSTGYDLDGYCSGTEGTPTSCTSAADFDPPDTEGGVDNIFGVALVEGLRVIDPEVESRAAAALEQGKLNLMLRIDGWSGDPRDPRVEVTVAAAAVTVPSPPAWDGTDVFRPGESFFEEGDPMRPIARDDNAYVADGVLVAQLPDRIPIGFDTGDRRLELRLSQARLTMSLLGASAFADAVLSGRWSQSEARNAAALLGLCADSTDPVVQAQRDAYLGAIERFADVRESADDTNPSLPCNALSFAVRLSAFDVQWGTPMPFEALSMPCP